MAILTNRAEMTGHNISFGHKIFFFNLKIKKKKGVPTHPRGHLVGFILAISIIGFVQQDYLC